MYQNDLIYGKSKLERVVSVEPKEDHLVIFQEMEDGSVVESEHEATYWFLHHDSISPREVKLEGNQYYKYIAQFDTASTFDAAKKKVFQKRLDIYSIWDKKEQNLVRQGITYFKGMKPNEVSVLSFDIESDGLKKTKNSEIYIITNTFRSATGEILRHSFYLDDYESQGAMLEDWCLFVRDMNPSLMIGHNIYGYDFDYIAHCAKLAGVSLNLGRDGSPLRFADRTSQFRKDGSQSYDYFKAYIYGREIVDTMFLSFKYDIGRAFPSYGLKPIIKHLGLEKPGRTFIDASKIKKYYYEREVNPEIWEKTKLYAEEDSDDALKLYDLMSPSFFYFTQSVSKTYQEINTGATGSQMNNIMVRAYLQNGYSVAKTTEAEHFEGAISFGVPGVYKNAFKVDVASLYPSIIREYGIYNKYKDPLGYFKQIVDHFALERLKNKKLAKETEDPVLKKYYTDLQESQKIGANSLYGFLGAQGLNYNYPFGAAEVTRIGREVLSKSVLFATGKDIEYWRSLGKDDEEEGDAA